MVNDEERLIRIDPGPELGNFTGFPLNAAGRQKALTWNSTIQAVPEHQSRPHAGSYSMRGPNPSPHIGEIIDPVSRRLIAYTLTGLFENANRTIWLDGRPHPSDAAERLWTGFSTGEWENGMLHVTTTHFKQMFIQRNGIPVSPYAVMHELLHPARRPDDAHHADRRPGLPRRADGPHVDVPLESGGARERHRPGGRGRRSSGASPGRRAALSAGLDAPRIRRREQAAVRGDARRQGDAVSGVRREAEAEARGSRITNAGPRDTSAWRRKAGPRRISRVRIDRPTRTRARSKSCRCRAASTWWPAPAATSPSRSGSNALFVVDTNEAAMSDKILAAIKTISPLPIRYIVNTSADPDHVGGNERFAKSAGDSARECVLRAGRARLLHGERLRADDEPEERIARCRRRCGRPTRSRRRSRRCS